MEGGLEKKVQNEEGWALRGGLQKSAKLKGLGH